MSLIAIDRSLRLYMVTNFFLSSKTLLVACICEFRGFSRRIFFMRKTCSQLPIGLLRQKKANSGKKILNFLLNLPKKKQKERGKKMDFVRSLSILRSRAPQAVGRKGVSPCTLVLSPVHSDPLHRTVLLPDISFFHIFWV